MDAEDVQDADDHHDGHGVPGVPWALLSVRFFVREGLSTAQSWTPYYSDCVSVLYTAQCRERPPVTLSLRHVRSDWGTPSMHNLLFIKKNGPIVRIDYGIETTQNVFIHELYTN